ncbi:MAG: AraC family transcriptional regulator [Cyanobacteria bacterium P01_F01_bin.150]
MTIKLTEEEFYEQLEETEEEELEWDISDERDVTYKFDAQISQGWLREVDLRNGLYLYIDRHQLVDQITLNYLEQESHSIFCAFMLSGKGRCFPASASVESETIQTAGTYYIKSNGTNLASTSDYLDVEPCSFVEVEIQPAILRSFAASPTGELPKTLQHLIKSPNEAIYQRHGDTQPRMNVILQQILRCPYQDLIKRAYLEGKVIELIALVLDHEVAVQQGESKKATLKPEHLERVYYAKEILLRDLSNPPSLEGLARQAGLNDFLLKRGFQQVFGTTVFGELRSHRLETAKLLLAEQNLTVTEVAHQVGYASLPAFERAFKRRFSLNPKAYQRACR